VEFVGLLQAISKKSEFFPCHQDDAFSLNDFFQLILQLFICKEALSGLLKPISLFPMFEMHYFYLFSRKTELLLVNGIFINRHVSYIIRISMHFLIYNG